METPKPQLPRIAQSWVCALVLVVGARASSPSAPGSGGTAIGPDAALSTVRTAKLVDPHGLDRAPAELVGQSASVDAAQDFVRARIEAEIAAMRVRGLRAPKWLLEIARKRLDKGTALEQSEALLILGLSHRAEDLPRLREASKSKDRELRRRAQIALGLHGSAAARVHLSQTLDSRATDADTRLHAVVALGLGGNEETGASSDLELHALRALSGNRRRLQSEIAAAFAGFRPDSGASAFSSVLSSHTLQGNIRHRLVDSRLIRLATAGLASRFASIEDWALVRRGILSSSEGMRSDTLWGISMHPVRTLSDRLRRKVTKELERRVRSDASERAAGLALLGLRRFDDKRALKLARSRIMRLRGLALAAAFEVIARHGNGKDAKVLEDFEEFAIAPSARAAWCLAVARLAKRLEPKAWPMDPKSDKSPFPLKPLRRLLTASNPSLVRAGAAIALTKLGDRRSLPRMQTAILSAAGIARRALAVSIARLDPRAMHELRVSKKDAWQRLIGLALSGSPMLWRELEGRFKSDELEDSSRARLLRLAAIAINDHPRGLAGEIVGRAAPGSLPPVIQQVARWLDVPNSDG